MTEFSSVPAPFKRGLLLVRFSWPSLRARQGCRIRSLFLRCGSCLPVLRIGNDFARKPLLARRIQTQRTFQLRHRSAIIPAKPVTVFAPRFRPTRYKKTCWRDGFGFLLVRHKRAHRIKDAAPYLVSASPLYFPPPHLKSGQLRPRPNVLPNQQGRPR